MEDFRSELKTRIDGTVHTEQHNLQTITEKLNKELLKLELPVHAAVLTNLQTSFDLRKNTMQMEVENFKIEQQVKHVAEEKKRQADIESRAGQNLAGQAGTSPDIPLAHQVAPVLVR